MLKNYRFNRICKRIKDIKIQGATNVARAALKAYYLFPSEKTKQKLISLRPTEPMLTHVLELADKKSKKEILEHFSSSQNSINHFVFGLIKNNSTIFTHCHSTNVVKALIYSKKAGKNFSVYNTETRPLYQGRKTSKELAAVGIKVTNIVDSAAAIAIKASDIVLFGADALLKHAVINKVGSEMFSKIAKEYHVPVYVVADSWKYSHKKVRLEERDFKEVWGSKKIHIYNPAFERIDPENIEKIITELGVMKYSEFLKEVRDRKD